MRLTLILALLPWPAVAEIGPVETPSGLARVEGDPFAGGERLVVGDRVVLAGEDWPHKWIEARAGSLLLVGLGSGGTACPALWAWVATEGEPRATEPFGTCSDLVEVSHDAETVTVAMPSFDAMEGRMAFVWDGKGEVMEVALGQPESGLPPGGDAEGWIGRYPFELTGAADWRAALTALMGEEGYADLLSAMGRAAPMEAQGDWVAGSGFNPPIGAVAAVAIHRGDGRLLVAVDMGDGPRLWGDPGGSALPAAVAEVMAQGG